MLLPIPHLIPHPDNANVMPRALFAKLVNHLRDAERYPPIIVRPHPEHADRYQILDGHHRVQALTQLNHTHARCDIWHVDDHEALLLLATLNRLEGSDHPLKRSQLLQQLRATTDLQTLLAKLPDSPATLKRLTQLRQSTSPHDPEPLESLPQPMHFFLLPDDHAFVLDTLKHLHPDRNIALLQLCHAARKDHDHDR